MSKRRANPANVIPLDEILISDDEEAYPPRKRTTTNNRSIDVSAENLDKRKRWPTNPETTNARANKGCNDTNVRRREATTGERASKSLSHVSDSTSQIPWNTFDLLSEQSGIDLRTAKNVVQLFEQENTIPFICRYRRDLINEMTPDVLRNIKNSYAEIVNLRKKSEHIIAQLEKEHQITKEVRAEFLCAKSNEELEYLYAPYKPANKGSLADRAKALGLEAYAERILLGLLPKVVIEKLIQPNEPNLDTKEKVENGICHIISHNISKHTQVLEQLRLLRKKHNILLRCTKIKSNAKKTQNIIDESKYEIYFDYQNDVRKLKPHQILAINRAEKQKVLSIKIIPAEQYQKDLEVFVRNLFMEQGLKYNTRSLIFQQAYEDCYTKKLLPLLSRQIRSELTETAKMSSIDVFAKNLKQLLLMTPLKGERILGIDPGFTNGCKLALISETSTVLDTAVIYPHARLNGKTKNAAEELCQILQKHKCFIIALGNGTACRQTELWLSKLFEQGILDRKCVRYTIVSEQGASIYSCSEVAKQEFPSMDINEISAVSIARRLNDPLSEYVKIEPKHIGVGMYQHDVNEKVLSESLAEVVSECVSFVGVDINTASLSLLKYVAGLTEKKADEILKYRTKKGIFRTREELLKVKSIGAKTFTQCAGFIRIEPKSIGIEILDNPLDCTWVHPEAYEVATKIIERCELKLSDVGKAQFINKIRKFIVDIDYEILSKEFQLPEQRLAVVLEALQRKLDEDIRTEIDKKPLFKQEITRLADLSVGALLTGVVNNVTHFGAFVDIGVECNGLIHVRQMNRGKILNIGDRVTVSILKIEIPRKRIELKMEE